LSDEGFRSHGGGSSIGRESWRNRVNGWGPGQADILGYDAGDLNDGRPQELVDPKMKAHYYEVMHAMGHIPKSTPVQIYEGEWTEDMLEQYYKFPDEPRYDQFPQREFDDFVEDGPVRTCDDIELGDESGDADMNGDDQLRKARETVNLLESLRALHGMYKEKTRKLRMIQSHVAQTYQDALVSRRLARQEKAMRVRKQMYLAYWNADMKSQWSVQDVWTGYPIRMKKKKGRWTELESDEERGSGISDEDEDGDDSKS
jgi:hypothetical protein